REHPRVHGSRAPRKAERRGDACAHARPPRRGPSRGSLPTSPSSGSVVAVLRACLATHRRALSSRLADDRGGPPAARVGPRFAPTRTSRERRMAPHAFTRRALEIFAFGGTIRDAEETRLARSVRGDDRDTRAPSSGYVARSVARRTCACAVESSPHPV